MGIEDRDWFRRRRFKRWDNASPKRLRRFSTVFKIVLVFIISFVGTIFILKTETIVPPPSKQLSQPPVSSNIPPVVSYYPDQNKQPSEPVASPEPITGFPLIKKGSDSSSSPTADKPKVPEGTLIVKYSSSGSHNIKNVMAEVNGIPVEFVFDTGASEVSFNTPTIRQLGIRTFDKRKNYQTAGGMSIGYTFKCASIKMANIEVQNVDCHYSPDGFHNLLGGSFLKNFNYYIDEMSQTITLIPRSEKAIVKDGKLEAVQGSGWAEVGGKKYVYDNGQLRLLKEDVKK